MVQLTKHERALLGLGSTRSPDTTGALAGAGGGGGGGCGVEDLNARVERRHGRLDFNEPPLLFLR